MGLIEFQSTAFFIILIVYLQHLILLKYMIFQRNNRKLKSRFRENAEPRVPVQPKKDGFKLDVHEQNRFYMGISFDGFVKSRHSGENRSPDHL